MSFVLIYADRASLLRFIFLLRLWFCFFFRHNFGVHRLNADSIEIVAVMSGSKTSNASANFQGGEITAIMGSAEVDLRNASIQNEATIQVLSALGGIEIYVPNDWTVVLNGVPILGGMEDHSVPPLTQTKRLHISGVVIMGGVEVKN